MSAITRTNRNFFYLVVLLACYLTYLIVRPYFSTIIMAMLVVAIYQPLYARCIKRFNGRKGLSVTATFVAMIVSFLAPILIIANVTIGQALQFSHDISALVAGENGSLRQVIMAVNVVIGSVPYVDLELTESTLIEYARGISDPLSSFLADSVISIGSRSIQFITHAIVFVAVLVSMLPTTSSMLKILKDLSPLDDDLDQKYISRVATMARAMVRGVFVIALAQGLVAGLFLAIGGVPYVAFWTLLCIFLAMLPMGVNVITIPVGIVLLATGSIWQGLLVIVGSVLLISNIDQIVRPLLVPKEANMSPVLVLIGALGGLHIFGFLGVIYGPVVMIFLVTTIEIYFDHYRTEPTSGP